LLQFWIVSVVPLPQSQPGPWVPAWTFGDRLRKVRRDLGIEQAEFAVALGVTRPRLGGWESGTRGVRADEATTIARRVQERYGVPAAWLLGVYEPVTLSGDTPSRLSDMQTDKVP